MEKKEVILFSKKIKSGEKLTLKERIKANGTLEDLRIKFYSGQERNLKVTPILRRKGNVVENVITYPNDTEKYIAGDNEIIEFKIVLPVENEDYIEVQVNNEGAYDYDLMLYVHVDYYGGKKRIEEGVF